MILIVTSSLRTDSNSRILAHEARRVLERDGVPVTLLDLREHPLPMCDGDAAYSHPAVTRAAELVGKASAILVATPIYNFDANAAVKNLIELTGSRWEDKAVGFLCAAGAMGSYMAIMSLASCLMLDFRCVVVPRFVYATGDSFTEGRISDADVEARVAELARATARLGSFLAGKDGIRRAPAGGR
jgi:FMN reductase